jgi:hypothetical protein
MLHEDYDCKVSGEKKMLVVMLKALGAKIN